MKKDIRQKNISDLSSVNKQPKCSDFSERRMGRTAVPTVKQLGEQDASVHLELATLSLEGTMKKIIKAKFKAELSFSGAVFSPTKHNS